MTAWTLDEDLAIARRLADAASDVSLPFFRQRPREWTKADGSIATEADVAVEAAMRQLLAEHRPDDAVLGEESGSTGSGSRRWILDGIDGTREFASGLDAWGTLIALEVDGRIAVGYCAEPVRHRHTWAVRGGGAFSQQNLEEPVELSVSRTVALRASRGWVPPPHYIPDAAAQAGVDAVMRSIDASSGVLYHPALEVAAGWLDCAVFYTGGPWDLAAPSLIVEEAGGRFSDHDGRWDIGTGRALYSNGRLHDGLLEVIGRARP